MPDVPTKVRETVRQREAGTDPVPRCLRCGSPNASEYAHRRTRSVRGEHQHCPCNGAYLCRTCHQWCHANPTTALHEGFMVSRHVTDPGMVPVDTWYGTLLLRCDGDIDFKIKEASDG